MDLYVLLPDPSLKKKPSASLGKIDMMSSFHWLHPTRPHELPDTVHWKTCILEPSSNILSHLKTLKTNTRTDSSKKILRLGLVSVFQDSDNLAGNHLYRPFPTRVDGSYDTVLWVVQENRNTVGRSHPYRYARKIRNQGIITFKIFPGHIRPIDNSDPRSVYLMSLNDRIGQYGIPSGGKSFHTRTEIIIEKVLIH